jgi:hypothetical protein
MTMDESFRNRLALIALIALLMALAPLAILHERRNTAAAATEADVEQRINEAAALAPDLSVRRERIDIIERPGSDKVLTYLIDAKLVKEYWFPLTDYRLNVGGDTSKIDYEALREAIDRAYVEHTSFPQEIAVNVNVGAPSGVVSGGLSFPLKSLLEVFGIFRGVIQLNVERVEIAVKGYADGELSPNWRPPKDIKALGKQYTAFQVLNPANPDDVNWSFYHRTELPRTVINFPYRNDDLPDLRAQFVRTEFVERLMPSLTNRDRCQVFVLHNKALLNPNQAQYRKVQIYVMVYIRRAEGSS